MSCHPQAFAPYLREGWCLVPVQMGTKGPTHTGWNSKEQCICGSRDIPDGYGAGLGHAYSGTCAIDLDDLFAASLLFAERGIDLFALLNAPDAVQINSGRPNSGKLLYALDTPLPTKKITVQRKTIFEFRCGTTNGLTSQDVLPPSIHPSGTIYQWAGKGSWQHLPPLPITLQLWWMELLGNADDEPAHQPAQDYNLTELQSALTAIDPDCDRHTWIECLMGMKFTEDPEAYEIAKEWSKGGEKYPGDRGFNGQWNSLKNDHPKPITHAAVYHHAKEAGWRPAPPDVSSLFADVTPVSPRELYVAGQPVPNAHLHLMPQILQEYAAEVAEVKGSSPVISAVAGMIAASAVADARSTLIPKLGMSVPPVLWGLTVGDPSAKKSQGDEPMFEPLNVIAKEHVDRYRTELLAWKGIESRHNADMKAYDAFCANPLNDLKDAPPVTTLPPQPVELRFRTKDATSQKLAYMAAERPYGIACIMDETKGWFKQLTANQSGDNRSTWTSAYDAKSYHFDRVGAGSLYIENFAIPIYGNVQPSVLSQFMPLLADDGLLQRFIPAIVPDREASKVGVGRPDYLSYSHQWEQAIRRAYDATKNGKQYRFDMQAEITFIEFEHYLENLKREERIIQSDENFRSALGKLLGQTARVAFIWHLLENPNETYINLNLVERAIEWVRSYLIPALRYFYSIGDSGESIEKWLCEYLMCEDREVISTSDLVRSARRTMERLKLKGYYAQDAMDAALSRLIDAGWCITLPKISGERVARYAVNPSLKDVFKADRQESARIRQARIEEVRNITRQATGREPQERFARGFDRKTA